MVRLFLLALSALVLGCGDSNKQLQFELQRSFNTFIKSVDQLHKEGLETTVYIPDATDYKKYTLKLLSAYMEQLNAGKVTYFDEQGMVLTKYIGLGHNRYTVEEVSKSEDGNSASMRIKVRFSYDSTVAWGGFEKGSTLFIPKEPWGEAYRIVLGEPNELPRIQLASCEIQAEFRKTNHEGWWQVRTCKVLPFTVEYEESFTTL